MKLVPQMLFGAKSQSDWTIQFVPKPRKMAIIILRRWRGTWEGVTVATWCSEWICRMWGGLGPYIIIIPASLSLPPMRGAAIGRAPAILQNDSFYTRISNFVQSPILLATRRGICKNWISKVLRDFFHQSESIQSFTCVSVLNDEHLQNYSLSRSTGKSFGCFHLNLWRSLLCIRCLIGAEDENLGYCV